ncbi:FeoA family protein [Ferruginibacter sp. HRS2-29]|uniref:FeoA family protein n=1 Tax=Ferruginibacter sp. HRS2-29 TaxID=2487334 RepID=UPI0020CBB8B9|nr:FeoA family protein [Ferruginibacter sp. HRS2-29]
MLQLKPIFEGTFFLKMKCYIHANISEIEINNILIIVILPTLQIGNIFMYQRLSEIKVGKEVIIRSFENDDIFLKLMEMGCVPGETITVDLIAPFKDPISISVAGYKLSLRLDEAHHILVEEI